MSQLDGPNLHMFLARELTPILVSYMLVFEVKTKCTNASRQLKPQKLLIVTTTMHFSNLFSGVELSCWTITTSP